MIRIVSHGGGVQSTALAVAAARGMIPHRTFVFANVGEDSEYPGTLDYLDRVAKPYMEARRLQFVELRFERSRTGVQTLWQRMFKEGGAAVSIPAFLPSGAPTQRNCTADHKVGVIDKWLLAQGASPDDPARVALGFSTDEIGRCKDSTDEFRVMEWPLITGFGLSMDRSRCMSLIKDEGLPVPPKSACFFCPWHSNAAWWDLKRKQPDLFDRAQQLEDRLIAGRAAHNNPVPVYLTRNGKRLSEVFAHDQGALFDLDDDQAAGYCDEGGCWT